MNELLVICFFAWIAGIPACIGGFVAKWEGSAESESKREVVHGVVAFGGGILVAAVSFALIPEGMTNLSPLRLISVFCAGGIVFCFIDARLARKGGSRAQFMAMLMDFIPEAIALGAVFAHDRELGILLALFIGAQNLPEGFNAYREIIAASVKPADALRGLFAISFLGPLAGAAGSLFLQGQPRITAAIMSFAAGGILYLIFQDIAPQSRMRRHWTPPLGAVIGFAVGMIGKKLLG